MKESAAAKSPSLLNPILSLLSFELSVTVVPDCRSCLVCIRSYEQISSESKTNTNYACRSKTPVHFRTLLLET